MVQQDCEASRASQVLVDFLGLTDLQDKRVKLVTLVFLLLLEIQDLRE